MRCKYCTSENSDIEDNLNHTDNCPINEHESLNATVNVQVFIYNINTYFNSIKNYLKYIHIYILYRSYLILLNQLI